MKCLALVTSAVWALSSVVQAAQIPPAPVADPQVQVLPATADVALYHCVRYRDERNIHPCAVPMIVSVPDPCPDPCACERGCVFVKICVPPCGCHEVKCRRNGEKLVYDFGKYEVEITSRRGAVIVDYDD